MQPEYINAKVQSYKLYMKLKYIAFSEGIVIAHLSSGKKQPTTYSIFQTLVLL